MKFEKGKLKVNKNMFNRELMNKPCPAANSLFYAVQCSTDRKLNSNSMKTENDIDLKT